MSENIPQTLTSTFSMKPVAAPTLPAASTDTTDSKTSTSADPTAKDASTISAPTAVPTTEEARATARFVALAKKERAIVEKERSVKASAEKAAAYEAALADAKTNPMKLYESLGLDFNTILNAQLDNIISGNEKPAKTVDQLVDEKLAAFKSETETKQAAAHMDQVISSYQKQIDVVLASDPKRFELVNAEATSKDVWELLEGTYIKQYNAYKAGTTRDEPIPMTFEQSADLIEDFLLKNKLQELEKLSKYTKLSPAKENAATTKPSMEVAAQVRTTEAKVKPSFTLTNEMVNSASSDSKPRLSNAELMKQAAALLKFR